MWQSGHGVTIACAPPFKGGPHPAIVAANPSLKDNPDKVIVGGGSAPGGPDHLTPMLLAQEVGDVHVALRVARHRRDVRRGVRHVVDREGVGVARVGEVLGAQEVAGGRDEGHGPTYTVERR